MVRCFAEGNVRWADWVIACCSFSFIIKRRTEKMEKVFCSE